MKVASTQKIVLEYIENCMKHKVTNKFYVQYISKLSKCIFLTDDGMSQNCHLNECFYGSVTSDFFDEDEIEIDMNFNIALLI